VKFVKVHGDNSIRYQDGEDGKIYQVDFNGMKKVNKFEVDELGEDLEHPNMIGPILDPQVIEDDDDHEIAYFRLSKDRVIKITPKEIKVCEDYKGTDLSQK
jgi:hypothetical protein